MPSSTLSSRTRNPITLWILQTRLSLLGLHTVTHGWRIFCFAHRLRILCAADIYMQAFYEMQSTYVEDAANIVFNWNMQKSASWLTRALPSADTGRSPWSTFCFKCLVAAPWVYILAYYDVIKWKLFPLYLPFMRWWNSDICVVVVIDADFKMNR